MSLKLVHVDEIPLANNCKLDDLLFLYKLCSEMEVICTKESGVGLSACQLGVPLNLFVYLVSNKKNYYEYYINCDYEKTGKEISSLEGCLSLKNEKNELRRFDVVRSDKIIVNGYKLVVYPELVALPIKEELSGFKAIVFQHEIDHAKGITINNIGKEISINKL